MKSGVLIIANALCKTNMAEEQVIIVDEENHEIKIVPRSLMRRDVLLHRSTYIIVTNSEGQILIQKRSLEKDVYPGYYDPTTGGVVKEGESYEENAIRELEEEIGVTNVELNPLWDFRINQDQCNVWGRAFWVTYDGPIKLVDGEVTEYLFLDRSEIDVFFASHDVMLDGQYVINRFLNNE